MKNPLREVRWFIQRGRRGWATSDTWSLDVYLAGVIGPALAHLANNSMSWPGEGSGWASAEDWEAELHRHAAVFTAYAQDKFTATAADEKQLHDDVAASLRRLAGFWGALWD